MKVRTVLLAMARVVADECEENAPFRKKVEEALGTKRTREPAKARSGSTLRPHRRTPALLDPIELSKSGAGVLRGRLADLSIEQLKDIVAEFGMDPSKLVMKWKDKGRVIEHITETSLTRAAKGDAFRG
jgi:hypothetical protein